MQLEVLPLEKRRVRGKIFGRFSGGPVAVRGAFRQSKGAEHFQQCLGGGFAKTVLVGHLTCGGGTGGKGVENPQTHAFHECVEGLDVHHHALNDIEVVLRFILHPFSPLGL